jgi:hypothetical protein
LSLDRENKINGDIEELSKQKMGLVHDIEEIRRYKSDMLEPQLIAATKELKVLTPNTARSIAKTTPG